MPPFRSRVHGAGRVIGHRIAGRDTAPAVARARTSEAALSRSRSDPPAFSAVYSTYARDVLRFFARRTLEPEAALDLTAECFAQAYAGRRSFRGRSAAEERAWLFTIAHRQLAGYYERGTVERKARQRLGVERPPAQPEELARVEELAGSAEMRQCVAAELGRLPEPQRAAVTLRVVDELGYPEVAARLQVSEQTARARVSRGLRTLRATLAPAGEEA